MYFKIKLPLEELYSNTLYFSHSYTKYACDDKNFFLGLKFRYEFVKLLVTNNFYLTEYQIYKTNYYKLISKKIDEYPRDGGMNWIYDKPYDQVNRFIDTTKSIFDFGYDTKEKSLIISDFEKNKSKHIERDINNKITTVNYFDRKFQGIIEVRKTNNKFIVLNGHHRLAILKAFKDLKIKKIDDKILTKFYCKSLREFLKVLIF